MSSFCRGCGNSFSEDDVFCSICGRAVSATSGPPPDPAAAFGFPPEPSGKAMFSLVCGILFLFPPTAIVAVIFGHLSLSEIRRSAGRLGGKGMAIAALVLGYSGLAAVSILMVMVAFSVRNARQAANQSSAVSGVRTLNTAEIAYAQAHPAIGYTCSLSDLSQVWGIDDLAQGHKDGYVFVLQGCEATKPNGPIAKYQLLAYPVAQNKTRLPAYCSNESDRIKIDQKGSPQNCLRTGADLLESQINHPQTWTQNSSR
jgi:peptidyl-prolyl cis-trans isomerase B (cyclophilin B)